MHNNYYLFKRQLEAVKNRLIKKVIRNIFTFRKDEIIFELEDEDNARQFLLIGVNSAVPYFLLKEFIPKHKSQIELFPFLIGSSIENILIIPFDKNIFIHTDNHTINAVFFGRGANLYIKDERGRFIDSFKKNIREANYESREQYDFTNIDGFKLEELIAAHKDLDVKRFLQQNFGAVNNTIADEICFRLSVNQSAKLEQVGAGFSDDLLTIFNELAKEIEEKKYYLYTTKAQNLKLSIFPLKFIAAHSEVELYSNLNKAWDIYIYRTTRLKNAERTRKILLKAIERRKEYFLRSLREIEKNKDIEKKHEQAVLKGNLLLTHKIRIKPHQSKVTLKNIYSDTLETIEIKMNPRKSVVENANLYFNKYKNIGKIKEKWAVKKRTVEAELSEIITLEKELGGSSDINKLNKIKDRLIAMNLLQDGSEKNKTVHNLLKYSFNHLVLDNRWEIFIGKNGKNNDLLTFTFAHKWDIWLHAQGVPGAHVIIRIPNRNTNLPKRIIEKAAQITAYHSKAQHSGIVPVIYTYVKYVHRIRKADPGTVNVQHEKVIFVEPLNIK